MSERNHFFQRIKRGLAALKRLLTYNIATIMFGALLLYMIITVVLYATSSHVTSYQVTVGPLTKNPVCTGLALRKEQIVPAGASGYVEYYAREGMQVRKDGSVYALTNNKKETKGVELSEEQLEKMRSNMANFSYGFSGSDFYDAYSFKYELQGSILQAAGIMEQKQEEEKKDQENTDSNAIVGEEVGNQVSIGKQIVYTAPEAGVVVYSTDGYEGITEENITEDAFNEKSYKKTDLLTTEELVAGDPVYKVITSENWTIMAPLTDKLAAALSGRDSIKVKFTKDGESQNGSLTIVQVGNQKAAKIQLQNGMPRYASDRFLEVELVINTQSGLKIPVSSVVEKEFYIIPREFLAQGNNGEGKGFIREVDSKSNSSVTEFVEPVIYREINGKGKEIGWGDENDTSGYCYVDKSEFKEGDVLKKQDSSETYTIGKTEELQGVYGMNKGYAVFRQINILDQNEEYCIVSQGTSYGLQAFDYIVLDGKSVKEEEILY